MNLFWLDDAQWQAIAAHLPSKQTGPKRSDDRVVISGIIHVLVSGCAWRDCPREYGPYMTVFNRFNRWKQRGIWDRIIATLTTAPHLRPLITAQGTQLGAAIAARTRSGSEARYRGAPPISPHAGQRKPERTWAEAAAQLGELARAHEGKPISAWIDAVVEWHMDSLFGELDRAAAALDAAAHQRPETPAYKRDGYRTEKHLTAEVADLRLKLFAAVGSLQSYLDDPARNAPRAKMQLGKLQDDLAQSFGSARKASIS